MPLADASVWEGLIEIVRRKVKPYRDRQKRESLRKYWWQYGEKRPGLRRAISGMKRVLANSQVSAHLGFVFLPPNWIYAHSLNIYAIDSWPEFCTLQSHAHEVWARFFGSSMKDDLRYTSSDCFETFPFPKNWHGNPNLEGAGKNYYDFRAGLMVRNNEGLTQTYNRFHDPDERSPDILRLRELHMLMDRAVLDAYGWQDLILPYGFLLDYEEDEEDEEANSHRKRKKPWRYRWPDEFRDEVLARLLALNEEQAEQERLSGVAAEAASAKSAKRGKSGQASMKATKKRNRKQQNEPEPPGLFNNIETAQKSAKG